MEPPVPRRVLGDWRDEFDVPVILTDAGDLMPLLATESSESDGSAFLSLSSFSSSSASLSISSYSLSTSMSMITLFSAMPLIMDELDERGDSSSGRKFVDRTGPGTIEYCAPRLSELAKRWAAVNVFRI